MLDAGAATVKFSPKILFQTDCNYLQRLLRRSALRTVAADFQPADNYVETAFALDLPFESVEQVAFELRNFSAAQAGHVDVIAVRAAFVEMLLALHVHEIEFIDQSVALEQFECAIDSYAVDARIEFARVTKDLRRVQVLLGRLYHAENGPALVGQAQPAGRERSLEITWSFGLW